MLQNAFADSGFAGSVTSLEYDHNACPRPDLDLKLTSPTWSLNNSASYPLFLSSGFPAGFRLSRSLASASFLASFLFIFLLESFRMRPRFKTRIQLDIEKQKPDRYRGTIGARNTTRMNPSASQSLNLTPATLLLPLQDMA